MKRLLIAALLMLSTLTAWSGVTWVTPTELSHSTNASWADVDVSGEVPAGTTGVILHMVNSSGSYRENAVRNNGSTDDYVGDSAGGSHTWVAIGVDGSRIFELYTEVASDIDVYLVGYFDSDATFFTNGVDLAPGSTKSWEDVDISSETGGDTPVAAIFYIQSTVYQEFGLRKNGSTDDRAVGLWFQTGWIVGVDGSELCEAWVDQAGIGVVLVGYLTEGVTMLTNGTDLSLETTGSWQDLSTLPAGATGALIEIATTDDTAYSFGIRKDGSSENLVYDTRKDHAFAMVEAASQVIEGYTESANLDFYLIGYTTTGAAPTYSVSYDANGGTGSVSDPSSPYEESDTVTVLDPSDDGDIGRAGHTFSEWNTESGGGGTNYDPDDTFSMPASNVTLYAQWSVNSYTLTYDGNGSTGGTTPTDPSSPYDYGETVTVLGEGTLVKTDYTFLSWNTESGGGGTAYSEDDEFSMPAANTTLYAQWGQPQSYYVDVNNGNDGWDGLADSDMGGGNGPWATIQNAVDTAEAGDTVYIRSGTYEERVDLTGSTGTEGDSGSAGAGYITYRNYPGEAPVMDGTSFGYGGAFNSGDYTVGERAMSYIKIVGVEIQDYPESGVNFLCDDFEGKDNAVGSHHIWLEDLVVHDNTGNGILINGGDEDVSGESHDIVITGCEVYLNGHHGIKLTGDSAGVVDRWHIYDSTVTNNTVYSNGASEDTDGIGIYSSSGNYDLVFSGNTCYDNWRHGIGVNETWNVVIEDNICYGNGTNGVEDGNGINGWYSENITVRRNTSYGNYMDGIATWQDLGSGAQWKVVNNVVYENTNYGINMSTNAYGSSIYHNTVADNGTGARLHNTAGTGTNWKNNIFANNTASVVNGGGATWDYNNWYPDWGNKGANSITSDPNFVDDANDDYRLAYPDDDINAGVTGLGVTDDRDGNSRGVSPDIGAYETLVQYFLFGGGS